MAKKTRIDRLIEKGDSAQVKKVVDRKEPKWDRQVERKEKRGAKAENKEQKKIDRAMYVATETKRGERRANREENKRWFK